MVAFLDSLEPGERAELEELFQPVDYGPGEHLFEQGDVSEGAFIVEEGEIDLAMELPGGERAQVIRVGSGSFVGELAWLQDVRRTLSATAASRVRAQYVEAVDFRTLLSSFRPSAFHLLKEVTRLVSERVSETERAAMDLCRAAPPGRATEAGAGAGAGAGAESRESSFDPRPYLANFPFFASFTRRNVEELLNRVRILDVPKGMTLVRAGQSDAPCWIVVYGALEAIFPESRIRLALLGPGAPFGHMERLLGTPAALDLRVREPAVVLELAPGFCEELMNPTSRLSYRAMHGFGVATIRALEHANLFVARERRMDLWARSMGRPSERIGGCSK